MSTNNIVIAIVAVLIVLIGGYFILKPGAPTQNYGAPQGADIPPATAPAASASTSASVGTAAGAPVVVTLTDSGFSPSSVTIKQGQSVTFVNQSKSGMWVASDPHPTHQGYSGTTRNEHCPDTDGVAFDECTVADQYTFTFAKIGSWGYHNHVIDEQHGTIVVTQ